MKTLTTLVLTFVLAVCAPVQAQQKPEHNGECALSASLGNQLPTDCSVVWISPKSQKLYCFSSENAKKIFLQHAATNERLAQAFWEDPAFWEKLIEERDAGKEN